MQKDFRSHSLFKEAVKLTSAWLRPETGEISSIGQLTANLDGTKAIGAAAVCDVLEGTVPTRITMVDINTGAAEILTAGPGSDSMPKWSPCGGLIAYLSDREQAHVNRLWILDLESRAERATPALDGFLEYFHWSPDGKYILLGMADFGSDLAGMQGAISVGLDKRDVDRNPDWAPVVEGGPQAAPWRSLWLYDIDEGTVRKLSPEGMNVWLAGWCGSDRIVASCSNQPEETYWYSADLRIIDIDNGDVRNLFKPKDQIGCLVAAPSGRIIALVEAVCSDRNIVAGNIRLIDVQSCVVSSVPSVDADVVQLNWRDDNRLLFVGASGPETIVGLLDQRDGSVQNLWRDNERVPFGGVFPEVTPLGSDAENILFLLESYFEAPKLTVLKHGREHVIRHFGTPETSATTSRLGAARSITWSAPDGASIQGWFLAPSNPGPHPVIMNVHGGPVWYYRPTYIGRSALMQMALGAGYALFFPNPRGSSGRGQDFARLVFGDMGGNDTYDYLSGLDALESKGLIDPKRIGVTGGSYGGYISSWLITQDQRFAASVPASPVTNWVSQHLTCNVPTFCQTFLDDQLSNPMGKYFTRSPIHHAHRVKTPTLHICGALDKITPPGQALEFHRVLQENGVESVLVTYPGEGHGVRNMPTTFDYVSRTMAWFIKHMPPSAKK